MISRPYRKSVQIRSQSTLSSVKAIAGAPQTLQHGFAMSLSRAINSRYRADLRLRLQLDNQCSAE